MPIHQYNERKEKKERKKRKLSDYYIEYGRLIGDAETEREKQEKSLGTCGRICEIFFIWK